MKLTDILARATKYPCFNGTYNGCYPAENKKFIVEVLHFLENAKPYPYSKSEIFRTVSVD